MWSKSIVLLSDSFAKYRENFPPIVGKTMWLFRGCGDGYYVKLWRMAITDKFQLSPTFTRMSTFEALKYSNQPPMSTFERWMSVFIEAMPTFRSDIGNFWCCFSLKSSLKLLSNLFYTLLYFLEFFILFGFIGKTLTKNLNKTLSYFADTGGFVPISSNQSLIKLV